MDQLVFEVVLESDGGYVADCLSEDIVTQGDTSNELRANVVEAVGGFYFDSAPPACIRLPLVRDEVVPTT